jgi:hypothetical protein
LVASWYFSVALESRLPTCFALSLPDECTDGRDDLCDRCGTLDDSLPGPIRRVHKRAAEEKQGESTPNKGA